MVKTILDNFCVKSGIFCPRCEEKLRKGQISDLDVKVIRTITEMEKENTPLQDVTYHKTVEAGDIMALLVDKRGVDAFMGSGAKLAQNIGDSVGKRERGLSYGGDESNFVAELFSHFGILTINTNWLPDASRETQANVSGHRPRRSSPIAYEVVKKLARELKGLTLRIEFES